jgi:hypothetical protein
MRTIRGITRSLLFAMICVLVIATAACGEDESKKVSSSCEDDGECGGGVCYDAACYEACTGQDDCAIDQVCARKVSAAGREATICVTAADFVGCDEDIDCAVLVVEDCEKAVCDPTDSVCKIESASDCTGKECGDDGCGGTCGGCTNGKTCEAGLCECAGSTDTTCDGVDDDCDGETDEDGACGAGDPEGCYDATTTMDFTGAIPGDVGTIVDGIVSLLYDPSTAIVDGIMLQLELHFGASWDSVPQVNISLFQNGLGDVVTDWFLNDSPSWAQCLFTVGQDWVQIISKADLAGQIKLSGSGDDGAFDGEQTWTGLSVDWAQGCVETACSGGTANPLLAVCTHDPGTSLCECSLDMAPLYTADVAKDVFQATLDDLDYLAINEHVMEINYGKFMVAVMNDLIMPYASNGQHASIDDALGSIIDCDHVSESMDQALLDTMSITSEQLTGFCEAALSEYIGPTQDAIHALALDSVLRLTGSCALVSTDGDLTVNHLTDGLWLGTLGLQTPQDTEFTGIFDAIRAPCE